MTRANLIALTLILSAVCARAESPSAVAQLGAGSGRSVEGIQEGAEKLRQSAAMPPQMFEISEKKGKKLMEIRSDQFGQPYLFAATVDKGTGEKGTYSATMDQTFVFSFRFVEGSKVQMMRQDLSHRAEPGSPEAKSAAESYPDSVIATVAIVSSDTVTGNVVIDARELFIKDLVDKASSLKQAYGKPMKLSEKDSALTQLKAFPKNVEVEAQLQFEGAGEAPSNLPDSRMVSITMHYSIMLLPSTPGFQPRRADARVGYFQTSFADLSDKALKGRLVPTINLINRWNLEKADPSLPVSDVKKPVEFWLDSTIPVEYRQYVRAGILSWNAAFEAAGLRNAIVVKEVDKDMPAEERANFDPANAAYNVVRWFMGDRTSMGVAPSRINPMTGEIFNASIRLGDQLTRLTDLLTVAAAPQTTGFGGHEHSPGCGHWQALQDAASSLALAEAQGPLSAEEKEKFLGQLLAQLTAHETGHTLGLRHNFNGGRLHSLEQVGEGGLVTSSYMHYTPPNFGPDGKPRGVYYQTQVGPYDRWAVEYGYKALTADELKAVAARSASDPKLKYCSDEDAIGSGGVDPECQRFVLGRDVVAFARQRAELADKAVARLEKTEPAGDEGYARLREAFTAAMNMQRNASSMVLPAIGGVRSRRVLPGDGPAPFEATPASDQRAALKYLDEKVFSGAAFAASPELMQRMAQNNLERRYQSTRPFPLAQVALDAQRDAFSHIYSPDTMTRLADSSLLARQAVTPSEVMITVRRSVWKEIEGAKPAEIPMLRRSLQREHVEQLKRTTESQQMPSDARACARRDLIAIRDNARRALADKRLDEASRAHLQDMVESVKAALGEKPVTAVGR